MSAQSTLENTLKEILRVVKPLREDWTTRLQIIDELRGAVESVESLRGATVEPFGSFVSDLFTRWGDLDVSIEFSNGSFVSPYGKKQKQRLLGDVMRAMRQKGGWRRYQLIPNARVPILKTCAPAIFPPLKDIYPGNLIDDLKGLRADTERRIEETCAANIRRFQSYNLRAENRSSLSELFISFLGKFSDISLKASELGICTYTGQWQAIKSNMRWLPQTYALFIEDPFEQPENSARAVSKRELTRISETFEMSHHMLISPNHSSLLATLVRPQMLSLMVRTPDWRRQPTHPQRFRAEGSHSPTPSNNNGPRQPTRPQVHRVVRSPSQVQPQYQTVKPKGPSEVQPQYQTVKPKGPSQVQPQFQTMNPKSHPNRATFKKPPLQTYEDQRQQIWRPRSDRPV
ncbi:protein HESO1 isoform X4 [Prunus persica]|uniref:protein HESO1 isoform X4 n=1 Tax=Prunus persica TaxID=3760 RepID=UPI0009AB4274|nr:protein HESO1 isoform X4 [Prunus persica]